MFLGVWHCRIVNDESYHGNGLTKVWHAFSTAKEVCLFPNNRCFACAMFFYCYPSMFVWVLAYFLFLLDHPGCHLTTGMVALSQGLLSPRAAHKVFEYLCSVPEFFCSTFVQAIQPWLFFFFFLSHIISKQWTRLVCNREDFKGVLILPGSARKRESTGMESSWREK